MKINKLKTNNSIIGFNGLEKSNYLIDIFNEISKLSFLKNKKFFISGSFLYSKNYNDIDIDI
ncbi:MAG: hypothetical protein HRU03_05165, partial [Nanoarchaeales archaeon]|nr:hypothetical protein [Nanoarchaeales archaeon]